ncbi:MAG TPA: G8 domain-containing protein [Acidobacteriota bacterium]|nr:G8 domain-containing protein [Acidobacteriota bacterium]
MNTTHRSSQRGSLLIVAMLICAIIGISLVSYINVGRSALRTSNRSLYNNAAMNLAENGLEEAMYSINKLVSDSTYSFSSDGWTPVGSDDMKRKWTGTAFDQNATGEVRVYIYHYNGAAAPNIVARALVTVKGDTNAAPVEKWVRVQLRKTSKFANGLVAKQTINFNGSPQIDSWNSDPDNNPATAPVTYSAATKNDAGSVGSISVGVNAVLVDNADIWGYVGTGGSAPQVGATGTIGPFGTPTGTTVASHVTTDFSASFDTVTAPSTYGYTSVGALSTSKVLPDDFPAATLKADGKYYIECSSIGGSNKVYTIAAGKKVVLKVTDTTGNCIDIKGGSGGINVSAGASLEIYAAGDINISGQGAMNGGTTAATMGQPVNLQIYGTKTSGTQAISVKGNGVFSGVLYAPFGSVQLDGSVQTFGSVVANDITLNGSSAQFHYDESLGNFGGNNPFRVTRWDELNTATDRAVYSSVMTF